MEDDLPQLEPTLRPEQLRLLSTPELVQKYDELKQAYRERFKKLAKTNKHAKKLGKMLRNSAEVEVKGAEVHRNLVRQLQAEFENDVKALLLEAFEGQA